MIKKLRIRNFKCYGPQGADFNLSRVNFIYGDNSAGKSSFLQFLEMLVTRIDYKGQYEREAFDRLTFKGRGPVSARLRAVTESPAESMTHDMSFRLDSEKDCYEIVAQEGVRIGPSLWDSILPKNDGGDRIVHWPSTSERERDYAEASALESPRFLNQIQMRALDDRGVDYLDDLLRRIGVPYSCVKSADGWISRDSLHDKDFGIDVALPDVGWGIQRIFRLVFALKDWTAGILVLEEPESNIDEAQLGALTRVLVEEALKRPQGQLIVECHSKLMVLQLAALVKEGCIPATVREDGVRVLEVRKVPDGSAVGEATVDDRGRITWPTAFFTAEAAIMRAMYGVGN